VRVAQLGPDPEGPGGMPAVVRALLRSPLADRYELDVIPTYRDRRSARRLLLFAGSLVTLVRWCLGRGPRIAHVHMAARGSMYRKAVVIGVAKALGRPVVLHVHAGPGDLTEFLGRLGPVRRRILRWACAACDRMLSVSASSAETLRVGLIDREIVVVPNAPPPIAPAGPRAESEQVAILYLGGFENPIKGGAVLLEALPEVLRRSPRARALLAGPGEAPRDLPDRVVWCGWLDESAKDRMFRDADVFVLPSLSEGLPVALLEAMSRELPIVASRVGGVPEVIADGVEAVLVDPGDPVVLAAALADLIEDPERRGALAKAAVERVERLAADDVYGRLDRIYTELTS
jgi:glycosyltransferase involved in cell wall biosynthesis